MIDKEQDEATETAQVETLAASESPQEPGYTPIKDWDPFAPNESVQTGYAEPLPLAKAMALDEDPHALERNQ